MLYLNCITFASCERKEIHNLFHFIFTILYDLLQSWKAQKRKKKLQLSFFCLLVKSKCKYISYLNIGSHQRGFASLSVILLQRCQRLGDILHKHMTSLFKLSHRCCLSLEPHRDIQS